MSTPYLQYFLSYNHRKSSRSLLHKLHYLRTVPWALFGLFERRSISAKKGVSGPTGIFRKRGRYIAWACNSKIRADMAFLDL